MEWRPVSTMIAGPSGALLLRLPTNSAPANFFRVQTHD